MPGIRTDMFMRKDPNCERFSIDCPDNERDARIVLYEPFKHPVIDVAGLKCA